MQTINLTQTQYKFIFIQIFFTLLIASISAYFTLGWKSAAFLAYGMYIIQILFCYKTSDPLLFKLIIFATVIGIVELLADRWLVLETKTLIYPKNEPILVESPLYMPIAWAVIMVQISYVGLFISKKTSLIVACFLTGILGGVFIPWFEFCAAKALWWQYINVNMIFSTPYYIVGGEVLICLVIPLFAKIIINANILIVASLGFIQGLWIWVSYFVFFKICS